MNGRGYVLLDIDTLRITERTDQVHERKVLHDILRAGEWVGALWVERRTRALMDGHHRLQAARAMAFDVVPCFLFDYDEVEVASRRLDIPVTPAEILRRARAGDPYPAKSTRHVFHGPLASVRVPFRRLRSRFERHHDVIWSRQARPCSLAPARHGHAPSPMALGDAAARIANRPMARP